MMMQAAVSGARKVIDQQAVTIRDPRHPLSAIRYPLSR
jgi:hypothetical protein